MEILKISLLFNKLESGQISLYLRQSWRRKNGNGKPHFGNSKASNFNHSMVYLEYYKKCVCVILRRGIKKIEIEIPTSIGTPCIHVKDTKVWVLASQSSDCHIITELTTFPSWTLYNLWFLWFLILNCKAYKQCL